MFSNLADGGTIVAGSNTFQADYEGGDGNDLTLTVVALNLDSYEYSIPILHARPQGAKSNRFNRCLVRNFVDT